jgi:Xaa-Pro dipeptidase
MPGPNLFYLTGLSFHFMERPIVGIFPAQGVPRLIVPGLDREKAATSPLELELVHYGEDVASRADAFRRGLADFLPASSRVAIEPLRLRFFEQTLIRAAAPGWSLDPGEAVFTALRVRKDPAEVAAMRRAIKAAQTALEATIPLLSIGMTEREMATALTLELYRAGSDPEMPFAPIVASGPHSSMPHAIPSDRKLQSGDLLLFDWGAACDGYFSDLTRTFAVGDVDPELVKVHAVVAQANAAGRAAARPGITCAAIDAATRAVIEAAGYGPSFLHRTGHGLGLEAHEPPDIRGDNPALLEPGMTFTVEPGIYLPGRGGVRIEDNVLINDSGGETLSDGPRELRQVG